MVSQANKKTMSIQERKYKEMGQIDNEEKKACNWTKNHFKETIY